MPRCPVCHRKIDFLFQQSYKEQADFISPRCVWCFDKHKKRKPKDKTVSLKVFVR